MKTNTYMTTNKMKPVALAVTLAFSAVPQIALSAPNDINLSFGNTTVAGVNGADFNFNCSQVDFIAGREFRMCDPTGSLGGGLPSQKDSINGTEIWSFDSANSQMTGVTNTGMTGGVSTLVASYIDSNTIIPTGDRDGGPAIDQGAGFFGNTFGFLAPFVGSQTVTAGVPHVNDVGYGVATITLSADSATAGTISIHMPVVEAQWAGSHFPLGLTGGVGVTFDGPVTNIVLDGGGAGVASFDYSISAEHVITVEEDAASAGFSNWSPEWYMVGSGTAPNSLFNVLPNSPTASIGVIGPTAGGPADGNFFNDGRITLDEAEVAFGVDAGTGVDPDPTDKFVVSISNACVGGCFDFTITGLTGGTGSETVQVVLPLSKVIPSAAVYRKYNATEGWHNFVEDANNIIESGLGTGTPVDCSAVTFAAGLTQGNNCVRLTILNGGANDNDGADDTTLVDPGGVSGTTTIEDVTIPAQSISDAKGCSISNHSVRPVERADWLFVAAFLAALGLRRRFIRNKN